MNFLDSTLRNKSHWRSSKKSKTGPTKSLVNKTEGRCVQCYTISIMYVVMLRRIYSASMLI